MQYIIEFGAISASLLLNRLTEPQEVDFMKNRNVLALMVFILGFVPHLVQAQIYSWVDEKGVKHYSDTPPADKKAVRDVQTMETSSSENVTDTEPSPSLQPETEVKPAAARQYPSVKMYTTQWCPVCKKAIAWFKANKVPFQELDVEASPDYDKQFNALGGKGYPLILVGKNRIEGWSEGKIRAWLGMK
jgi:glutaredoxin